MVGGPDMSKKKEWDPCQRVTRGVFLPHCIPRCSAITTMSSKHSSVMRGIATRRVEVGRGHETQD
jgi:hypothetical protein